MGETCRRTGAVNLSGLPNPGEVLDALDRLLNDAAFQASARRKAFLRFLVEETLAGRAGELKGFQIATTVFGRDQTFDSQTDPVVRLEARRLRRDLEHYYLAVGHGDPVRISIPKGAYVPTFERQNAHTSSASPPASEARTVTEAGGGTPDAPPDATNGLSPAAARDPVERGGRAAGRGFLRLVVLALLASTLLITGSIWLWNAHLRESAESELQERGPTVIVLPFESLSTREDDRFLAAGITQQLITDLMRFDAFKLYSVPSSFRQDASADPVHLGRSLAVGYVVKGSVRSSGEKVRVNTQLFEGKTGQVLWSETYDGELTPDNMLDVQNDLSDQIATHLGQPYGIVRSAAAERLRTDRPRTMFAYECVLRAYAYRSTFSRLLYAPARACLEEAVRIDPAYANAFALLAWLHLDAARYRFVPESAAAGEMDQARTFAERAVELAPNNPLSLQSLAAVSYYRGDFDTAEKIQRQALVLNPNDPEALAQLGWRLAFRGRWDEGLGYLRRAIARSLSPPAWYHTSLAMHAYLEGNYAEALLEAEQTRPTFSGIGLALYAMTQAALGDQTAAKEALDEMTARVPHFARDPADALRIHHIDEPTIDRLVDGMRKAGWKEPDGLLTGAE